MSSGLLFSGYVLLTIFKGPELSQVALALNFLSTLALGFVFNLLKTPFKKKVSYVPYRIVCEHEIV